MKPDIKETIRNEYVHGYINDNGQRVMPTLDDLIGKYNAASSTIYRASSQDQWKQQKKEFSIQLAQDLDIKKTEEKLAETKEALAQVPSILFAPQSQQAVAA